uniref:long-chain fatty acid transport protein 2-like n=1 Tax=Myxine glutinosa TaxID=7769 RepID=UPI00358E50C4
MVLWFFAGLVAFFTLLVVAKGSRRVQLACADLFFFARLLWIWAKLRTRLSRSPPLTIVDRFLEQVRAHPHKPFLVYADETHTYEQVARWSARAARALVQKVGVRPGDTVAILVDNEPLFVMLWLAFAGIACPVAFLNHHLSGSALLHCFGCSGAKYIIVAQEFEDTLQRLYGQLQADGVSMLLATGCPANDGVCSLEAQMADIPDESISYVIQKGIQLSSPFIYIYTSGTTGRPKAAIVSHLRAWLGVFIFESNGMTEADVLYISLPLYHSSGTMGIISSIQVGATVVLRKKFSASQFWNDCRKYNVTVIQYIGELCRYLCNQPETDMDTNHKVRLAIGNGMRQDVWHNFLSRFGPFIRISEFYGATEGNIAFINYMGHVGAVGRTSFLLKKLYPFELIKYDTETEEPKRDELGWCIKVNKGEDGLLIAPVTMLSKFSGYAGDPELTKKKLLCDVFKKGDVYFNSGDLLMQDEENFLYFVDRVGDTFRWKGENVATTEVEETLEALDFIQEANVYGVNVPGHEGKAGMASVVLKPESELNCRKLYEHMVIFLPTYARPLFVRVQDSMEVTGTLKQQKVKLVKEGFNPSIHRNIYFLDIHSAVKSYVPLTPQLYQDITCGRIRL